MHKYHNNGVATIPESPAPLDHVAIYYSGLLPKCGASEIYCRLTYDKDWNHSEEHKMTKYNHLGPNSQSLEEAIRTFQVNVQLPVRAKTIDFCFHDSANNWDNNYGMNFSIGLSEAGRYREGIYNPAKTTEDFEKMIEAGNYTMIEEAANGNRTYRYPSGT